MKRSAVAERRGALLVDRLDQEFSAERLASLGDGAAKDIPWRLWRHALYAPLHDFLSRPGKEFRSELLATCWGLDGRKDPPPPDLGLAVEILHAGSLVVDDIEDASDERRGGPALHRTYGVPTALNAGNWLYFWPFRMLDALDAPAPIRAAAHRLVTQTLLECHYGQALDLSVRLPELDPSEVARVVRAVTELKTGSLVALAAGLGALVSEAPARIVHAATRFGRDVGTALQMLDDVSGLLCERRLHKGREDLVNARPTWPWAWLAGAMDPASFRDLAARAEGVAHGEPPERLARELALLVAPHGKRRVHAFLEQAFARLAAQVPDATALGALRTEIERLEQSYV